MDLLPVSSKTCGRPCCVPSRASYLLPSRESVASCVYLDEGKLVWRNRPADQFASVGAARKWNAQYAGQPVKGDRVAITIAGVMRRLDASRVTTILASGEWPHRGGRPSAAASKLVDAKLLDLMRLRPEAGVRALATMLNVAHSGISRRLTKWKQAGVVDRVNGAWTIEVPAAAHCEPWVVPLKVDEPRVEDDRSPYTRTAVLALLKSFPTSNALCLSQLAGRNERATMSALAKLAEEGLAVAVGNKWDLTMAGRQTLRPRPYVRLRPGEIGRRP
jgi:hypothetical protein